MKNLTIAKKVYLAVITSLFFGTILAIMYMSSSLAKVEEDVLKEKKTELDMYLNLKLKTKYSIGITNAINIAHNKDILDAYEYNDRSLAVKALKKLSQTYRENTGLANIKVHLHTADVKSFLRAWSPKKHGDDLSGFRATIVKVKNTKKPLVGIEAGRAGLVLRGLSPLFKDGEYIGSVEFIQGFNSVVKNAKKDLDARVLFVMDKSLLNIATKLKNAPRIGDDILAQKDSTVDKALLKQLQEVKDTNKKHGFWTKDYFVSKKVLKDFAGNVAGAVYIAQKRNIVEKSVNDSKDSMISQAMIIGLMSLVGFGVLIFIFKQFAIKPIENLRSRAGNLASGDGDLTQTIPVETHDEVGMAANEVNNFILKVRGIIEGAKNAGNENAAIAQKLSGATTEVEKRVLEGANLAQEATSDSNDIKLNLVSSLENANESRESIKSAHQQITQFMEDIATVSKSVSQSSHAEIELSHKVSELSVNASQIKEVLTIIGDIADQTNLLALNAAIEAARAGEHGRGFAVVADEVRQLAERTQKSLVEINATINVIVQSISQVSESMDANAKKMKELASTTDEAEEKMKNTAQIMDLADQQGQALANDFEQTAKSIDGIVKKIEDMNTITSQNAKSIEEISKASEHLSNSSEKLSSSLNQFRT